VRAPELDREQRVAFGFGIQLRRVATGDELGDCFERERTELELAQPRSSQCAHHAQCRGIVGELLVTSAERDRDREIAAPDEMQQRRRGVVEPVNVIEDQWSTGRPQRADHRIEHPRAILDHGRRW
jgi:hypothetical protein